MCRASAKEGWASNDAWGLLGFLTSYDKLFGGKNLSSADHFNVQEGKETTIDRSLRLLYVTCSRAYESLALMLWSTQPEAAMAYITDKSGRFAPEEVLAIPWHSASYDALPHPTRCDTHVDWDGAVDGYCRSNFRANHRYSHSCPGACRDAES